MRILNPNFVTCISLMKLYLREMELQIHKIICGQYKILTQLFKQTTNIDFH